jgi:mannose-6-phosphate isomerase-like protein (cupin superfamily)
MNTLMERKQDESTKPEVHVISAHEGHSYWMVGDLNTIQLGSKETDGALAWLETLVIPQGGPPPHIHHREDELFYILSGEVTFYADGQQRIATEGTLIYIPRGTVHYFKNTGLHSARMITLYVGAGMEGFFAEVGVPPMLNENAQPAPFTPERKKKFLEAAPKYGLEFLAERSS